MISNVGGFHPAFEVEEYHIGFAIIQGEDSRCDFEKIRFPAACLPGNENMSDVAHIHMDHPLMRDTDRDFAIGKRIGILEHDGFFEILHGIDDLDPTLITFLLENSDNRHIEDGFQSLDLLFKVRL
ncbi:MAG: hypothetical protein NDI61_06520, partial [Bdellovibrionaceae bacterium]|nr:hypothetical protein [Pseudobdellovibrionaceae bacterium]